VKNISLTQKMKSRVWIITLDEEECIFGCLILAEVRLIKRNSQSINVKTLDCRTNIGKEKSLLGLQKPWSDGDPRWP